MLPQLSAMSRKQRIVSAIGIALIVLFLVAIWRAFSWRHGWELTRSGNHGKMVTVRKIPTQSLAQSWIESTLNDDDIAYCYKISLYWDGSLDLPISQYTYFMPVEGEYVSAQVKWSEKRAFVVTFDQNGPLQIYCRFRGRSNEMGSYDKAVWSEIPIPVQQIKAYK
jgi:hypothetical protein